MWERLNKWVLAEDTAHEINREKPHTDKHDAMPQTYCKGSYKSMI